ncbi:uncharacterized protein LOC143452699 [Clavelina lepadiformis]|uniref:uncharacterized protein LOC143452699 n=1 Tax=Clavelina lepadiformis TaxID=159417 RepID=UPI004042CD6C
MKLLLVLFACIAASSALSYIHPYNYWCAHKFCVFPTTNCYTYSIKFNHAYCDIKYYAPYLKYYPNDRCGQPSWRESSVPDLEKELRGCLRPHYIKASQDISSQKGQFINSICAAHAKYTNEFEHYIKIYYNYLCAYPLANKSVLIAERDRRINEYKQRLLQAKLAAVGRYCTAARAKLSMVAQYHEKMVKSTVDCLNTRLQKLAEYKTKLDAKIKDYVNKFTAMNLAICGKNVAGYRAALHKLYDNGQSYWEYWKLNLVVSSYHSTQKFKVYSLSRQYAAHLAQYRAKLVQYYTCAYRCYAGYGNRFSSKTYYTNCKSLGTWYCYKNTYKYARYSLSPFVYKYRSCTYKNLKKCDVNDAGSIDGVVAELTKKRDEVVRARTAAFSSWKSKWISIHLQYIAKYEQIIKDRHNWYIQYLRTKYTCNGVISYNYVIEINRQCAALQAQSKKLVAEYKAKLAAQILDCVTKFTARIAAYKKSVNDLIAKVKASFETCKTKRTAAIGAYKKKLEAQRDAARKNFIEKMYKAKNVHWRSYHDMLEFYHGSCYYKNTYVRWMYSCYADRLVSNCNVVIRQFDADWRKKIDDLVQHYACSYKCTMKTYCAPTYHCGSYFNWVVKIPTPTSYCFQYRLWCYYH